MTSSPPATDTQINPSGMTSIPSLIPPITPSVSITPVNPLALTQHAMTLSQNPFNINWLPGTTLGTNFPYNAPIHHNGILIPSIPFPDLTRTPAINIPNLNTITQTLSLPTSNKEVMIKNIQAQMELMQ